MTHLLFEKRLAYTPHLDLDNGRNDEVEVAKKKRNPLHFFHYPSKECHQKKTTEE